MINLLILLLLALPTNAINLRIHGEVTEFERQAAIRHMERTIGKIVDFQYKRNDYELQDGDIDLTFLRNDQPWCGNTRGVTGYRYGETRDILIPYRFQSARINLNCLDQYKEQNHYYAFLNTALHETACHALSGSNEHLEYSKKHPHALCIGALSSNRLRWTRRDRRYVRRKLKEME